MAFIVPVVRRDIPLYTQRQPLNTLAIHKRRCESLPINFHDVNSTSESTSSILKEEEKIRITHPSNNISSILPKEKRQMPSSSIKTMQEWLFPNRRISITRLDNNEMENSTRGKNGRKRVHFGICERVEYGEKDEKEENENGEQENVDPNDSNKRMESLNGNQENMERTKESNVDIDTNRDSNEMNSNINRPRKRDFCPSIMAMNVAQKDQNVMSTLDSMSEKSNKYNAIIFRLMSSLCTSKM